MSIFDLLQEISITELATATVATVAIEDSKTSISPAKNAGIVESETPAKMKQCLLHITTVVRETTTSVATVESDISENADRKITLNPCKQRENPTSVATVATVAVANKKNEKSHVSEKLDSEMAFELFSERAAIQEYDGGLDRLEAERQAFYWVWERAS